MLSQSVTLTLADLSVITLPGSLKRCITFALEDVSQFLFIMKKRHLVKCTHIYRNETMQET